MPTLDDRGEDSVYYYLAEVQDDLLMETIEEMESNRHNPDYRQSWRLIPANMLVKEWNYNQKTGLTHDKIIEKIETIIVENYCKLYINTVMSGHSTIDPYGFCEGMLPEGYTENDFDRLQEDCDDFICDDNGAWRLSDYGLTDIENYIVQMLQTNDGGTKLYLIDRILNVVHQRSDLASWFVEGGSKTLSRLFKQEEYAR